MNFFLELMDFILHPASQISLDLVDVLSAFGKFSKPHPMFLKFHQVWTKAHDTLGNV